MQSIERMGRWVNKALYKSYLVFYAVDALLGLGGWPDAAKKDFDKYWHERFYVPVTAEMVSLVFPFFLTLKSKVTALGNKAGTSARSLVAVLEYLAGVLIQDAVDLSGTYPKHPAHAFLLDHEAFW
jgi:hypothetical protein